MIIKRKILLFLICLPVLFSSCSVFYPSRMLSTGKDYKYAPLPDSAPENPYKLAPNDELIIILSTNSGQNLINPVEGQQQFNAANMQTYIIEYDGTINIPLLRRISLGGMTIHEAENYLEKEFSFFYKDPYVKITVKNNRVIVFPGGEGGSAKVVTLENTNTTLFEALAMAGGISDGKSYKIKLIRGKLNDRKVYRINLSKIEGLSGGDIVLQANDIIYVEPVYRVPKAILTELTPYVTLTTTVLLIFNLFK